MLFRTLVANIFLRKSDFGWGPNSSEEYLLKIARADEASDFMIELSERSVDGPEVGKQFVLG